MIKYSPLRSIVWISFIACLFVTIITSCTQSEKPSSGIDAKVDSLMALMTLEEKIGQLNLPSAGDFVTGQASNSDIAKKIEEGLVGGLFNIKSVSRIKEIQKIAVEKSRLKIPLIFGMDVIHGYQTEFPIPLAISSTWDMNLIEHTARIAAIEASADGINWTFSPMVDISRDPRWGRVAEGSGEDPFLGYHVAKAMVRGYQGDDLTANNTIMACVKHFALYGAAEAGRDYNTTDMSEMRMFNDYMLPYKGAVEAGAGSVMTSFNDINGVPASANKWLTTDVLRNQWGFNGFVVTDYTSINEMVAHGIGDLQQVTAQSLNAGVDMDMVGEGMLTTLKESLEEGKVTQAQIDEACRRILTAKFKLGLFDDPYKYCDESRANEIFTPENRAFAREAAAKSIVLLKNEKNILPLTKNKSIALIGPLADAKENMVGTWAVATDFMKAVSLREGLQNALGDKTTLHYAKGSNLSKDDSFEQRATMFGKTLHRDSRTEQELLQEALRVAAKADVIVAALGESAEMSGESSSRTNLEIPDTQQELLKALLKTGKPVVLVLFNGRPLSITWENANVPAIVNAWFGGTEAGNAIADVLFGDVNPSGKLTATFPQNVGQVPLYYAHRTTGRPLAEGKWFEKFKSNYLDVSNEPLYAFGYGLSYTTFSYEEVKLSSTSIAQDESITVTCTVSNTGSRDGEEIVQLYVQDVVGSVTRPVRELKGFEKIMLKVGESKEVSFTIGKQELSFYNQQLKFAAEPGEFKVYVGGDSNTKNGASFELR
ncbi:beta-glucosidase BglX [Chryseotalea sanaruensis]|uniref:Periplasmic beta-glucosidase n=1 Tax=Chryseotalea sanaruensis TaxID=2482724 RepID=A0A401U577_9BACT|nr:beta-glucosidase BglX [Chryseotalea sanaruensis]GCC50032.1 beta-glucosidase BglX [Chryseotalea sanaruensis]